MKSFLKETAGFVLVLPLLVCFLVFMSVGSLMAIAIDSLENTKAFKMLTSYLDKLI